MSSFQQFDFKSNVQFQQYLESLYPPPDQPTLLKLQKKWYKKHIDPNYNYEESQKTQESQKSQEEQQQPQKTEQPQQPTNQPQPQQSSKLPLNYIIENFFKCMYFPCIGLLAINGVYLNIISSIVCVLALLRMVGKPRYDQQYLAKLMPNEFLGNLMLVLSLLGARSSLLFQLPIALHFIVGACEFCTRMNVRLLNKFIGYIKQNRNVIILSKQKIEVYLFIYSIFGVFIGTTTLFQAILMFQLVSLKSKVNPNMQYAQRELKITYERYLSTNQSLPTPVRSVFQLIWKGYDKIMNIF